MNTDNNPSIAGAAVGTALSLALVVAAVGIFLHMFSGVLTP